MTKCINAIWVLAVALLTLVSCDDYETYGEMKERERDAISAFIADSAINVISEQQFEAQGQTTDVSKNEYVYLDKSGIYMQIVRKGTGTLLEEDKQVNVLCRYTDWNILSKAFISRNDTQPRNYDKMTVTRTGSTYTASFVSGVMKEVYGSSVPAGWLVPFMYINLGRQAAADQEIALVKMIVPHTQGQSYATSNVYACHYVITYEREK